MYRFALRPFWIASHVFVVVLVLVMGNLGFWQLRRLDERKEFNATVRASLAQPPVPLSTGAAPEPWDRLIVRGTYLRGADVLVGNKTKGGQPGFWVLSPLDTPAGMLTVNRGFIARAAVQQQGLSPASPPEGEVELVVIAQPSRDGVLATESGIGEVPEVSQVNVDVLAEQWGRELLSFWGQATTAQGALLEPVGDPQLDNGPHLGYAVQWFVFMTIAAVGYVLILRRNARAGEPGRAARGAQGIDGRDGAAG